MPPRAYTVRYGDGDDVWGANGRGAGKDVTATMRDLAARGDYGKADGELRLNEGRQSGVFNRLFGGDPAPGKWKVVAVRFRYGMHGR